MKLLKPSHTRHLLKRYSVFCQNQTILKNQTIKTISINREMFSLTLHVTQQQLFRPLGKLKKKNIKQNKKKPDSSENNKLSFIQSGLGATKLEYSLKLKIERNDWLPVDTCPQIANHCALFCVWDEFNFYNLEVRSWELTEREVTHWPPSTCSISFLLELYVLSDWVSTSK